MTTSIATALAGAAIIASPFMISRKGLLSGMSAAVVLGVAGAILLNVARSIL